MTTPQPENDMDASRITTPLRLPAGADLALRGLELALVRVRRGGIWLTQHHDVRDYLLYAGDEVRIDNAGTVVMQALADAEVDLVRPRAGRGPLAARVAAVLRALSPFHPAVRH
jgi:hypothetical protein